MADRQEHDSGSGGSRPLPGSTVFLLLPGQTIEARPQRKIVQAATAPLRSREIAEVPHLNILHTLAELPVLLVFRVRPREHPHGSCDVAGVWCLVAGEAVLPG